MNRYISLSSNIDVKIVVRFIQELLSQCDKPEDCFLKLEIVKVSQTNNELLPKIEYKP